MEFAHGINCCRYCCYYELKRCFSIQCGLKKKFLNNPPVFLEAARYFVSSPYHSIVHPAVHTSVLPTVPPPGIVDEDFIAANEGWGGQTLPSLSWYEQQLLKGVTLSDEKEYDAWVRMIAKEGDDDAQYALARKYAPPNFSMASHCQACGTAFSISCYRHHCRSCGGSFCHAHSWHSHALAYLYQHHRPMRVCLGCKKILEIEDQIDRIEFATARVNEFLAPSDQGGGYLAPYFDVAVDSNAARLKRCIEGAVSVAKTAPLSATVKLGAEVADVLLRYGVQGLAGLILRKDFIEAAELLRKCASVGDDDSVSYGKHEMAAAIFYVMAEDRGIRGNNPDSEEESYAILSSEHDVLDNEIENIQKYAALPLHFLYSSTPADLQVLCNINGWTLIVSRPDSKPERPAYALVADKIEKRAILAVRGTANIHDVATDIKHVPVPFPIDETDEVVNEETEVLLVQGVDSEFMACGGIARAAHSLFSETCVPLKAMEEAGYSVTLSGHSMGGAVAALLGYLLRPTIPFLNVHAFGTPACCTQALAKACDLFVTSIILHDDIVPRLTPSAVQHLLYRALRQQAIWVNDWNEDWDALVSRAKGLWTPRWRRSAMRADVVEQPSTYLGQIIDAASHGLKRSVIPIVEQAPEAPTTSTSHSESAGEQHQQHNPTDLFLPGRILHIYSHRSVYKARFVPRDMPTLRVLQAYGNCCTDHLSANYFDALGEVLDISAAQAAGRLPPAWMPYNASDVCQCCGSGFTWASTSQSSAQINRDKHNCRQCGKLVCDSCAKHRQPIPDIGLKQCVRVCDACFFKRGAE